MKKKVISAVAAMTLLSTGAFAFDANSSGEIVTHNTCSQSGVPSNWFPSASTSKKAAYQNGTEATAKLEKSLGIQGDALIYPAFTQANGHSTEVVFRNMHRDRGIVAKVVLYSADNSRELRDFNVYLSANDAFRFEIKDGKITTKDESFMKSAKAPYYQGFDAANPNKLDSATPVKTGEEFTISTLPLAEAKGGYVVVYAMAQAKRLTGNEGYHETNGHVELFKDYRIALDKTRTGWRKPYSRLDSNLNPVCNGVIAFDHATDANKIEAPNVAIDPTKTTVANDFEFTDPAENSLSGVVSIANTNTNEKADMVIPATALKNFTEGNLLLWTEGEYASLQDRRISTGKYNSAKVQEDAETFLTSGALYSFKANSANNLLFTQPFKRILVQLGNTKKYWSGISATNPYGGFQMGSILYDEAEGRPGKAQVNIDEEPIISPVTIKPGEIKIDLNYDELAVMSDKNDLQNQDNKETGNTNPSIFFKGKNGFGYSTIMNDEKKIPAIVTQQMGSLVDGTNQMNWVYVPFNK